MKSHILLSAIAVLGSIGLAFGQAGVVESLRISTPANDEYVAGQVQLRAQASPASQLQNIVFFVDGRQICSVTREPYVCMWDAGPSVEAHQVRAVASFANGHRLVENVRTKALSYADSAHVDLVEVTATVSDGHGNYIKGLPQSAFHVWEDGRPQTITNFASHDIPLDLMVALDISGSMAPAMPKLKQAAKDFLGAVSSRDRVTVLGFNDSIFTVAQRGTDPDERAQGIDRLAAWGTTALYDVIINAVDMLGRESGRRAVIVFTDGEDQGSHAVIEDVEQRLQASDVTLYIIAQGRGTSMDPLKKIMRRLSEPTGGRALFTEKIEELDEAFAELLEELSNQYLLGYSPTNNTRDETLRHIKLEVDGHHTVRAREAYRLSLTRETQ
jgi:VWFA-related protein